MGAGDGFENSPWLEDYLKQQKIIGEKLYQNQLNLQFPLINLEHNNTKSLLQRTLLPLEEKEYILNCWVIPRATSTRGWHEAIEVLIYNPKDIKEIPLIFNDQIDLETHIQSLDRFGSIDIRGFLKERPTLLPTEYPGKITPAKILSKCYSGWYSFTKIDGSYEAIAELHQFEPHITGKPHLDLPTFMFAAQKQDKRIGWTYFPVGVHITQDESAVIVVPDNAKTSQFISY